MSVRALKARILCDQTTVEKLWRTHLVFNEKLLPVIRILMKMRRGEVGSTPDLRTLYQDIGLYITNYSSQQAEYLLNSISMADRHWKCSTPGRYKAVEVRSADGTIRTIEFTDWMGRAIALSTAKQLAFDKEKVHGDLPGCIRQMISRDAVAIISGHDELTRIWHDEHEKWLKERAVWEAEPEHREYLAVRPQFEEFERQVGGTIRERRGRWHKYLGFLRANPSLAAWRGAAPNVNDLDEKAKLRVLKARPWKRRSVEAEEFWKVNEELRALDRLHGEYERKFVRRGRSKRNADGFKHRPTFTEPDAVLHPRWFTFNAPQTNPSGWADLRIPEAPDRVGQISLVLLTGEKTDAGYPFARIPVRFKADPRLCDFRATKVRTKTLKGKEKGEEKEKDAYVWRDHQLGIDRPASIGGIKLMFDVGHDGSPGSAYLVFTCDIDSVPLSELARKVKSDFSDEIAGLGTKKKFRGRSVPDGLVSLAVDIGIRHAGFATLAKWEGGKINLLRTRNIRIDSPNTGEPTLRAFGQHKRELRRRRRQRGNPVKGESSHVELQKHVDHMAEDRFKKAARAIVNLALNAAGEIDAKTGKPYPRADVLIVENLGSLKPDATFERGVNTSIATFNHGHLVDRIRELAADVGLRVQPVRPWATSQICHRCGSLGRRYSIRREAEETGTKKKAVIHFGSTEALFACPKCAAKKSSELPFTCNSDFNAAVNHQRCFYFPDALSDYGNDKESRNLRIAEIEASLEPKLRRLHGLVDAVGDTPW